MASLEEKFDQINKEARDGLVFCGTRHWLYYSTYDRYGFTDVEQNFDNAIAPCLKIGDKDRLLESIESYVEVAKSFYGEVDYDGVDDVDKYTIATVLSNMTYEDFDNPIKFFEYRRKFLEDKTLNHFKYNKNIGYSELFDADIEVEVRKESIFLETPYGIYINLVRHSDDGRKLKYQLPVIRYGIADDTAYIYAIQKDQSEEESTEKEYVSFSKKIRRKMYKVNSGLSEEERNNEEIDNIQEVSPWAVIALSITLGLLKNAGIDKVLAFPLLINRWNSNVIFSQETLRILSDIEDECYNEYKNHLRLLRDNMDILQKNISDKFVRTFRRIGHYFPGISVDDYYVPMGLPLFLDIEHGEDCNNELLQEMFNIGYRYEYQDVKRKIKEGI